jgi:GntR family transcriptional regulator
VTVRDRRRSLAIQVRDELAGTIRSGGLRPGDQLPSEAELVEQFGVARTTVREALKLLEQDGLLHVQHGVGRFVVPSVERPITRLETVTELMASLGYEVTNRVLEIAETAADEATLAALGLLPGARVIRLERVRLRNREPLIYSIDVVPADLPGLTIGGVDWSGSLGALLRSLGHEMATALADIRAVTLPPDVSARIGSRPGTPWLLMVQTHLTDDGRPIIYSHDYHRGDLFTFQVLRRADPGAQRSQT